MKLLSFEWSKVSRTWQFVKLPHRYGNSHTDTPYGITMLPATRQRWQSLLNPRKAGTQFSRHWRDARLSWTSWLVTYRDGVSAQRWSPLQLGPTSLIRWTPCHQELSSQECTETHRITLGQFTPHESVGTMLVSPAMGHVPLSTSSNLFLMLHFVAIKVWR